MRLSRTQKLAEPLYQEYAAARAACPLLKRNRLQIYVDNDVWAELAIVRHDAPDAPKASDLYNFTPLYLAEQIQRDAANLLTAARQCAGAGAVLAASGAVFLPIFLPLAGVLLGLGGLALAMGAHKFFKARRHSQEALQLLQQHTKLQSALDAWKKRRQYLEGEHDLQSGPTPRAPSGKTTLDRLDEALHRERWLNPVLQTCGCTTEADTFHDKVVRADTPDSLQCDSCGHDIAPWAPRNFLLTRENTPLLPAPQLQDTTTFPDAVFFQMPPVPTIYMNFTDDVARKQEADITLRLPVEADPQWTASFLAGRANARVHLQRIPEAREDLLHLRLLTAQLSDNEAAFSCELTDAARYLWETRPSVPQEPPKKGPVPDYLQGLVTDPFTLEPMAHPLTLTCGHTFDRLSLFEWRKAKTKDTCGSCRQTPWAWPLANQEVGQYAPLPQAVDQYPGLPFRPEGPLPVKNIDFSGLRREAEIYHKTGAELLGKQHFKSAIAALSRAITHNPTRHTARLDRARAYAGSSEPGGVEFALADYRDCLIMHGDDPAVWEEVSSLVSKHGLHTWMSEVCLAATPATIELARRAHGAAELIQKAACTPKDLLRAYAVFARVWQRCGAPALAGGSQEIARCLSVALQETGFKMLPPSAEFRSACLHLLAAYELDTAATRFLAACKEDGCSPDWASEARLRVHQLKFHSDDLSDFAEFWCKRPEPGVGTVSTAELCEYRSALSKKIIGRVNDGDVHVLKKDVASLKLLMGSDPYSYFKVLYAEAGLLVARVSSQVWTKKLIEEFRDTLDACKGEALWGPDLVFKAHYHHAMWLLGGPYSPAHYIKWKLAPR